MTDRLDRLVQAFDMTEGATAIYGRLIRDCDAAMLVFTNAGHLPPLVRLPDGGVHRIDRGSSVMIGAMPAGQDVRSEGAVTLPAGSTLLPYTDGLVETRDADIDAGIDDLVATLESLRTDVKPDDLCDAVLAAGPGEAQDDDIAILAVHID